ncbi:MAG: amidohydrolase [Pararhodobacter sp.]|nr:amidohydrolase [Pararhodobacter sp.]
MRLQVACSERVLVTAARICRSAFDATPATAMLVADGQIGWVGEMADAPAADRRIDLGGLTLLPGLTDAHLHVLAVAQARLQVSANDPSVHGLADFVDRLRLAARELPGGAWVIGTDVNEQFWPERRLPDRFELDRALPNRPVAVRRFCGHVVCLNTAAMDALSSQIDLRGIGIDEDERGLNGIARERAAEAVFTHLPRPDDSQIAAAIQALASELAATGLTALNEAAVGFSFGFRPEWAIWQRLRAGGGLPVRMGFMLQADPDEAAHMTDGPSSDPWWQIRTLKVFVDGIIGARTAALSGGFADGAPPGPLLISPSSLHAFVQGAHRGGWQVAAHAIGDLAIEAIADAYAKCIKTGNPENLRHRIEHLGLPGENATERLLEAGAVVVTQPSFVHRMGDSWPQALGARATRAFPAASLFRAGVPVAGSSDAPTGELCPWAGVAAFVTRLCASKSVHAPEERLTVAEALHAYTYGGAYAMQQESWRGKLFPGQAADFAAFECNPLDCTSEKLGELRAALTVVAGRAVHDEAAIWPTTLTNVDFS